MKLARAIRVIAIELNLALLATAAAGARFQSASPTTTTGSNGFGDYVRAHSAAISVSLVALGIAILALRVYWQERPKNRQYPPHAIHRQETARPVIPEPVPSKPEIPTGPPPTLPDELVDICASGNAILLAGPGLGSMIAMNEREYMLSDLVFNSLDVPASMQLELRQLLEQGRSAFVSDAISARTPLPRIVAVLLKRRKEAQSLLTPRRSLRDIPFAGVLTTAWDDLCEQTFEGRHPAIIASEEQASNWSPSRHGFYIIKVRGDLEKPGTVVFGAADLRDSVLTRRQLSRVITSETLSRPMFMLGMTLDQIEEFFDAFLVHRRPSRPSFALTPYTPFWQAQVDRFQSRYGVTLIGYNPDLRDPELEAFLSQLGARVKKLARARNVHESPSLRALKLTNIGVFETLSLDFTSGWNVILGNNGSGKSTILRAIAVALAGENADTQAAAQHLLRQGAKDGSIEVRVGEVLYRTELRRERDRIAMTAAQLTPLQNGDWVVLGFPPLRGVSMRNPSGPSGTSSGDPTIDDLLPLLRGALDTRLDSLKQWLVNIEVNATTQSREAAASQRLRDSFFELLQKFTPGQIVSFARLDRKTWQPYVFTDDGEIPIDDVSQGMSSVIGWVGTLLQRMFEIHADAKDPTTGPALVLVDELDAHLHPEWQQKLPAVIREHFPRLQIIATTHSPLIVSSLTRKELFVALRNPTERSQVVVSPALIDPEGMRVDQILTTPLFGLESTRNAAMAAKISRYAQLLSNRKSSEEREFQELRDELATKLMYGETERELIEERAAIDASRETMDKLVARVAARSPEEEKRLRAAIGEGKDKP